MARDNWDDLDTDMAALAGRSRRKLSVAWTPLLVVGALTFVGAFYVPMHRAHRSLTEQHGELLRRTETVTSDLEQTTARRDELETERRALATRMAELDERTATRARALEEKRERIGSALTKLIKAGAIRLEGAPDTVVLEVSQDLVFAPQKLDVTPKGKDLLCDVARATGESVLLVSVPTSASDVAPPALRQVLKSSWAVGAARASQVADTLEKGCRFPRGQVRMAGVSASQSGTPARIRFEVVPPGL